MHHAMEPISELAGDPASPVLASLRLMSTVANVCGAQSYRFLDSMEAVIKLLGKAKIPASPLDPPISTILGCLAGCPVERCESFPDSTAPTMVNILRAALPTQSQQDVGEMFQI